MAITPPIITAVTNCGCRVKFPPQADFDEILTNPYGLRAMCLWGVSGTSFRIAEAWKDPITGVVTVYGAGYPSNIAASENQGDDFHVGYNVSEIASYWTALDGFGGTVAPQSATTPPADPPMLPPPMPTITPGTTIVEPPCSSYWAGEDYGPEPFVWSWIIFRFAGPLVATSDNPNDWSITYSDGKYTIECPESAVVSSMFPLLNAYITRYDEDHAHWHSDRVDFELACVKIDLNVSGSSGSGSGS